MSDLPALERHRVGGLTLRFLKFLGRHPWSISLSALSALSFAELASEVREDELGVVDEAITRFVSGWRGHLDGVMRVLTDAGGVLGMTVACVATALVLLLARRRWEASFLLACGTGAGLLCTALKLLFQRARPDGIGLYLLETPGSFSFPSGHAMGTTGVVGGMAVLACTQLRGFRARALVVAAALLVIFGVATSRVYFGVHFPSDVAGGCLGGAAWVAAMTGWFYPRLLPGEAAAATSPRPERGTPPSDPGGPAPRGVTRA